MVVKHGVGAMNPGTADRTRASEGQGHVIDTSRAPDYVVVSTYGALDRSRFEEMLIGLAGVMDDTMGPGRAFCPIIFDMSCSRLGAEWNVPAFREAEKPLLRRYRDVVMICSDVTQTELFDFLFTVFTALAPRTHRADSLDQAVRLISSASQKVAP